MYIQETDSTNSLMARLLRGEEPEFASCLDEDIPVLYTGYQTSGRGQTGNGWEAERDKNLLLTYLLKQVDIAPAEQFRLNIIAAIATHRTIAQYLPEEQRDRLTVKWPNDIYFGDRKIAGILVENSLSGKRIMHSIAGIGINLNQEQWISNAPNPVSLKQITGSDTDIHQVMRVMMQMLHFTLKWNAADCRVYYMQHLYRREGYWSYVEREVSTVPTRIVRADEQQKTFQAQIRDIADDGSILLQAEGETEIRKYHFKQIQFVI